MSPAAAGQRFYVTNEAELKTWSFEVGQDNALSGAISMLTGQPDIEKAMTKNIIEMALGFTAMIRVFSSGSKARVEAKLEESFSRLAEIATRDDYEAFHRSFCEWFTREIRTAGRKPKNGKVRPSQRASYGHAAKVLDIATKVYAYYCTRPNAQVAQRIVPFLHGAIDIPIMEYLRKSKHATTRIVAKSIQEVDEITYQALQSVVSAKAMAWGVHPVQLEDVLWRRLNRKDPPHKTPWPTAQRFGDG